jgi:hypothetical protein
MAKTPDQTSPAEEAKPLSRLLREIATPPEGKITVEEIARRFGRRALGGVLFAFSIPNLLPLPPGSSTVLGLPLVLAAPQLMIGSADLWLPRAVRVREIDRATLAKGFDRLLPKLEVIEKLLAPRLGWLFGPVGDRAIGLVCTLLALVLILPIPLGNLLPAAAVALLALGLMQRDGIVLLMGYGAAAASAGVLVLSAHAVAAAVRHLIGLFN